MLIAVPCVVLGATTQTPNQVTVTLFKIRPRIGFGPASSLHAGVMQPATLMGPSNYHKNINGISCMIP